MLRTGVAAVALVMLTGTASPSLSQDFTIGGGPVPPEQLEAVQLKCEELFAALVAEEATDAAELPAAGASDDAATTESAAETPVAGAEVPVTQDEGNMAADTPSESEAVIIDLESLTADLCKEGGFGPPDAQGLTIGGAPVRPDQLEAVQTKCEELLANLVAAEATDAGDKPAAGASDDPETTESAAEAPVASAEVAVSPESGNLADDSAADTEVALIDLEGLTADVCREGGFGPVEK